MVGLWEQTPLEPRRHLLRRHESGGWRSPAACLHSPRVLFPRRSRRSGSIPQTRSSIWAYLRELRRREEGDYLPHHALHGRGRELRSHRDHRSGTDRRVRLAGGAQGQRRQGSRADPHGRRPGGDPPPCAERFDISTRRSRRASSRSPWAGGERFVPAPVRRASASRSRRSTWRGPSLDDVFMGLQPARRSVTPRPPNPSASRANTR